MTREAVGQGKNIHVKKLDVKILDDKAHSAYPSLVNDAPSQKIELLVKQWRQERPDVNPEPMRILGRVDLLAHEFACELDELLRSHGLTIPEFDVLAVLRRCGEPFRQPISVLCTLSLVTSGTMTNRIDRLEAKGLVSRAPNPDDRRGILVVLSPAGRELIDTVVPLRLKEANERISALSRKEQDLLARLLDRLLETG